MQTPVRVEILGRQYTLRVAKENAEQTRAVARRVNERMRAFQRQHPEQAKLTTAIITALALAQDLQTEREAHTAHADALDADLRALTGTLNDAVAGAAPGDGAAERKISPEDGNTDDGEDFQNDPEDSSGSASPA